MQVGVYRNTPLLLFFSIPCKKDYCSCSGLEDKEDSTVNLKVTSRSAA